MEKIIEFRDKSNQYPRLFQISKLIHPKSEKVIESFQIQICAFKKRNIIPILARGFFINSEDNSIIARGYDKFFNIGETKDTLWENIVKNTIGPFELTLKENGCTIFVSVYEDDLFIISKNNFTKINQKRNLENNNYSKLGKLGEKWLNKYIINKREQFIKFIKENNITLIFELIDNNFEEHVLEYSKEEEGLYLCGINENSVEFKTWPIEKVNKIAEEYNFIPVKYKVYNDLNELKKFVDSCNGYYNDKSIKGWDIRCKKLNGDTFFFKYKYEPYLLYREWRKATLAYINNKIIKYNYMKTYEYMDWVKQKYQTNKELFIGVRKEKDIIKLRKMYLEETNRGKAINNSIEPVTKEKAKYKLILPIGIFGLKKIIIGRMLKILYDIDHIQSDNTHKKKQEPKFATKICEEFNSKSIIMADMSNCFKVNRSMLCKKLKETYPNTLWIVALYWNIETVPEKDTLEFVREKDEKKDDKIDQNLNPEKITIYPQFIKTYLSQFENLDIKNNIEDNLIDEVIEVDFKEDTVNIVKKIINTLNLELKTDKELEDAFKQANEKPEIKSKTTTITPLYYGLRTKYINCKELAIKYLKDYSDQHNEYIKDYEHVKFIIENSNFLQREHVTLAFYRKDPKIISSYYNTLIGQTNQVMNFNNSDLEVYLHVSSLVWTSNLAFLPIDKIESDKLWGKNNDNDNDNDSNESEENNKEKNKDNNNSLYHITLASYGDAKPVECRDLLKEINNYYKKNNDIRPVISNKRKLPLIDESYVIDDTNKEKEKEIIHPETFYQLLPSSIKNTSFMKPIKIIEGENWKQLFF
jgi:tRNA splicing ligase